MGQNKENLNHLLNFVKKIYSEPDNQEFASGIQAMVLDDMKSSNNSWSDKIDEIYEYCLHKNLKEQAEDLYKNFPLQEIVGALVTDYIKMEQARRNNDFDEFGLRLYQQIENIMNVISSNPIYLGVVKKMMNCPAIIKFDSVSKNYVRDINGVNVASFALIDSQKNPVSKKMTLEISDMFAIDKLRLVIYFVCYKGRMQNKYFDEWRKYTTLFSDVYMIRNCVHKGGRVSDHDKKRYDEIHSYLAQNYLKFISGLLFLIEGVQNGYPLSDDLLSYSQSLP